MLKNSSATSDCKADTTATAPFQWIRMMPKITMWNNHNILITQDNIPHFLSVQSTQVITHWQWGPTGNVSVLIWEMPWSQLDNKPLHEPTLTKLTDAQSYVNGRQWMNDIFKYTFFSQLKNASYFSYRYELFLSFWPTKEENSTNWVLRFLH